MEKKRKEVRRRERASEGRDGKVGDGKRMSKEERK